MGYLIAAVAGLILISMISRALKFAFKIIIFVVVAGLLVIVLKNFAPGLF